MFARLLPRLGPLVLFAAVGACATGGRSPLPNTSSTVASFTELKTDPAELRLGALRSIRIDPGDGFDPEEIMVLAVLNSPALRAKRVAAKVMQAQVFDAGLLPDPQITGSADFPVTSGATIAYAVGAAIDIQALITRSATLAAARADARQADLDLLWAEWQTAQQARQLAWTATTDEARAALLQRARDQAKFRAEKSRAAMARGDITGPNLETDLAVELDAQTQLTLAQHDAAKARLDLNAILDLKPDVRVPLVPEPPHSDYDAAAIASAARQVASRRPDLLALRAGYAAENAKLRRVVLSQFPLLNLGGAHASDNTGIISNGVSGGFALPIFNGSRGKVAIEKATREQLRAEYQARLDQTEAEVANAKAELAGNQRALRELAAAVPRLERIAAQAAAAYGRGDIDSATYLTLAENALSRRADLEDKRLATLQAEAALEQALFLPPAELKSS